MATLVDGLGHEELGDAGDPGSKASQIWVTGSVTSEDQISGANIYAQGDIHGEDIVGDTTVSGAKVYGTTMVESLVVSGAEVREANGLVYSASMGAAETFGGKIKAGSLVTAAGSSIFLAFPTSFGDSSWYSAITGVSGADAIAAYISGAKHASGALVIGGPAYTYDWIAVGA